MKEYHLSNWSVTEQSAINPWIPPECSMKLLQGHREEDGKDVITSSIEEVDGKIIRTASGSTYFLGEPDPKYLAYLESIGYAYDPENPIKDKRTDHEDVPWRKRS